MTISSAYHMTKSQLSEEEMIIEQAKIDPAKFGLLYEKYYEQIFRYLYQRVDDMDISGDLCSQAFLKALTNLQKYENRGVPFSSWLYRIAGNELNQFFRQNKNSRFVNVDTDSLNDILEDEVVEHEEKELQKERLIQLLGEIDDESLTMIEMRYFEKRSFKEIGEILDITENNAKVRLYRLVDKLKKRLR